MKEKMLEKVIKSAEGFVLVIFDSNKEMFRKKYYWFLRFQHWRKDKSMMSFLDCDNDDQIKMEYKFWILLFVVER